MPDRCVRLKTFGARFFTVTPRRLTTLILSLAITVAVNSPAVAAGPLRVNPVNSRYFFDADGAPVFLAGSYQNPYNLLNGDSWDLAGYFDYLAQHNHNFTRLWAWEQSPWMFDSNGQVAYSLQPFERTGSSPALDGGAKFDLTRFNQAYFDQLRTRVIQAGQRGIYVSVILFEGFSSQRRVREINPWLADPFQRDNNINGVNADPNGNGRGEEFFSLNYPSLTALQEAFVRKIVDTLNDLDNVLYEISGDTLATSLLWQYHMIDYLKQYQSSKANQHPVGISQFYARKLAEVLNSRADWIVTEGTNFNPPVVNSNKVVFNEGRPILFTYSNPDQWVWRAFTRGYNLIYPEAVSDDAGVGERVHAAIGQSRAYSQFLNLSNMFPSTTLCSKDFCLGSQGSDYLVYLPSAGQVSIDLSAATINFVTAWFDPVTGQTLSGDSVSGGKRTIFTSPIRGQSVLQIRAEQPASGQSSSVSLNRLTPSAGDTLDFVESSSASQDMVSTPKINPNGGIYSGSVRVSLSTKTQSATIYYTTDGKSPTQSSKKYTGAFTLTGSILVKAKAFKNGKNPSAESGAWFADIGNSTGTFNFTLANSGDKSVSAGSSIATTITATLGSPSSQTVSFTTSGLPSGATAAFSSVSCVPTCSSTLTVSTSGSTPTGNYLVSVGASGGGQTRTTSFNLSVSTAVSGIVATPTFNPNGGSFAGPVALTMQTATAGAAVYYTTDGSAPTLSSIPYTGAITISTSSTIRAKAFKSAYGASNETSAAFTVALPSGLVGHWKFDEGTGSTAMDSSGNGNTGKLTNSPLWTTGKVGKALYFNGIDSNVSVLASSALDMATAFTLSAWVNPTATSSDFRAVLVKNYKTYLYSSVAGYCGNGTPLGGFSEINNQTVCDQIPLAINNWSHLAVSYDGASLTLYRDGAAIATVASSEAMSRSTGTLQIGASQFGEFFQGMVDEVRVYNRALSTSEIQTIYQQEGGTPPNQTFSFLLANSGNRSVTAGSSITNTIAATLASGTAKALSFAVSGLPSGATSSFSTPSCSPTCSTVLSINTTGSTPSGSFPITVTAAGGGVTKTTFFTLSVTFALTVATPTLTPNGGSFTDIVSVAIQTTTPGASIYYTTDGSIPTQSSIMYTGAMTLTSNAAVNAKAFKNGYDPSALAAASFTVTNTIPAATYYVGKNGSDTHSCTQARVSSTPKLTINAGLACIGTSRGAGAGQIVEVGAGTYVEAIDSVKSPFPSGTSWLAPFTLRGRTGDVVTIRNKGELNLRLFSDSPFYSIVQGFVFDGINVTSGAGQIVFGSCCNGGSYIRFQNNELITSQSGNAILIGASSDSNEILHNKIHGGAFGGTGPSGAGGNFAYPLYMGGFNTLIEGNEIYDFPSWGIHGYPSPKNNIIRQNIIHDFGSGDSRSSGILIYGDGNQVYNNLIYNGSQGITTGSSATNTQIHNNNVYNMVK